MGRSGGYLRSPGPGTAAGLAAGAAFPAAGLAASRGLPAPPPAVGLVEGRPGAGATWAGSADPTNTTIAAAASTFVGQVVNLRRIGNPPVEPCGQATNASALAAASRGRINNPPQVNNLPHKLIAGLQPCRPGCGSPERRSAAPRAAHP